ncbi:MAG: hypothetical protein AB7J37_12605 [Candidatus Melainabacteria bacterium]
MATMNNFFTNYTAFFKRNNPMESMALAFAQMLYNIITFQSRMKLYKYKYLLELEKLEKMQETLTAQGYHIPKEASSEAVMNKVY